MRFQIWGLLLGLMACKKAGETVTMGNSPPSTPGIALAPANPPAADDLVVTVVTESEDPDGDNVEYNVVWSVDGEVVEGANSLVLPSMFTTRGETWSVRITAFDGIQEGGSAGATVFVENAAPTVGGVQIIPALAYERDTLTCLYDEPVDLDNDEVGELAVWVVNDEELGVEGPLTGDHFNKHDKVECWVYADDGVAELRPHRSASVEIQNTTPNVIGCSLADNNPPDNIPLEAISSGAPYDEDDDSVSLRLAWYVNWVMVSNDEALQPADMSSGDNVYVECTAWDGEDEGNTVSSGSGTVVSGS